MKVISEYKLDKEQIKIYRDKGYEVYYGYENPVIKSGESVGFLLDTLYPNTIDTITSLLHRKHKSKISIEYNGKKYLITNPVEWKASYYNSDTRKWERELHPVLEEYYTKRKEYTEAIKLTKEKEELNYILDYFNQEIPEDLDLILDNFARLYEIEVDKSSLQSKLLAYASIKFYLDNDIEYSRDILGQDPTEELMFDTVSFGDETYLEDTLYKTKELV